MVHYQFPVVQSNVTNTINNMLFQLNQINARLCNLEQRLENISNQIAFAENNNNYYINKPVCINPQGQPAYALKSFAIVNTYIT